MRRRSDRSYSTSFGAGLSDGSRVTGAAAGSTTGAPPRAYDLMKALSRAQPDPTTAKMMKSARPIVRRVESIVSPPSASPESVAPGFLHLVSRLGPSIGNKDAKQKTAIRTAARGRRFHQQRGEARNASEKKIPAAAPAESQRKASLGSCDGAQVSDSRPVLGHRPPAMAAQKSDAGYAHDARRQTWPPGRGSYAGTPLEARVKGQVSGYGPK